MKRYHSYKLREDSLEQLADNFLHKRVSVFHLQQQIKELQQALAEELSQRDELENKVIYLMQAKHKKSCIVNRVQLRLTADNNLEISIVLD